jgi:hypothetical protein
MLRHAIQRGLHEGERDGRISPDEAVAVRGDLDRFPPRVVLAGHWRTVIVERKALRAYAPLPSQADDWRKPWRDEPMLLDRYHGEAGEPAGDRAR